jgi:tetrahydromethanopterin S-methyltransferase subunit D
MREILGWEPLVGYFSYMIGAILFNINGSIAYAELSENAERWVVGLAAMLGGLLFTVGGFFECTHNHVFKKF